MMIWWLACGEGDVYIVEGKVVEVRVDEIVLDHKEIRGLMGPMVMPFQVTDPKMLDGVAPGDLVAARYRVTDDHSAIEQLRVTGHGMPPDVAKGPVPVRVGQPVPAAVLPLHDGQTVELGPAQVERIALTFVYTTCPKPEFCPAMTARLQALQQSLGDADGWRIVAVTLDPEVDTTEVLAAHARVVGAGPRWSYARLDRPALADLAMTGGLPVLRENGDIAHGLRLLVLDRGGALIERYDDAAFPLERVKEQLLTGEPKGDPSVSGTRTVPTE